MRARARTGEPIREGRDIRIGDYVIVQRAGDVIPQIVDILPEKREAEAQPYQFPDHCPVCGAHAVREVNEKTGKLDAVRRCTAGFSCRAQAVEHLKHFVSRNAFDIEGLGAKQVDFFFEHEDEALAIRTAPDIFTLERRQAAALTKLENFNGWGKTSVANLYQSINERGGGGADNRAQPLHFRSWHPPCRRDHREASGALLRLLCRVRAGDAGGCKRCGRSLGRPQQY